MFQLLFAALLATSPVTVPSAPAAKVEAGLVSRRGSPAVEVRVPPTATYLGAERFSLFGVADCELHLFVDVDDKKQVKRLYWVQFEEYLPELPGAANRHEYDYSRDSEPQTHWGQKVWVRSRFYPGDIESREGSDMNHFRGMVERAGYALPPWVMYSRFVRLLDDKDGSGRGRRELMLIYGEDMTGAGFKPDDFISNGDINEKWAPHRAALIARAATAMNMKVR